MEQTHTPVCPEWAERIAEHAEGTLTGKRGEPVTAHLETCAGCAQAAQELAVLSRTLRALPAYQTSPAFEARLAARLADMDRQRDQGSWQSRWAALWQGGPRLVRPALALGALSLVTGSAVFLTHLTPITVSTPPSALAADHALVSHCVEQHRTEAAAQPLSDISAQNLAAHVDSASVADAGTGSGTEDGL